MADDPHPIHGRVDPAFRAVEDAFRANLETRNEIGGSVCVRVDGRVVVDLWGGYLDETRRKPWERDTLVNAYSVGKGITAMLVLSLVERGELDLDAAIEGIWPEFAAEGKGGTTLRQLLSHQGGHPGVRRTLAPDAMLDWDEMTRAFAEQAPFWAPGTAHGYHVNSFGFLVGEPVCRTLGLTFTEALATRICGPIGADFHIGLPAKDHARVAPISVPHGGGSGEGEEARTGAVIDADPIELTRRSFGTGDEEIDRMLAAAYFNPIGLSGVGAMNTSGWREAAIPSTNGHGNARAVANLYDTFMRLDPADGGFVGPGLRDEATRIASDGIDRILGKPSRFGLGFQLSQPTRAIGGSDRGYGHFGYGGTLGFADPDSGIAFGYLMNRPGERWQTPRTNALVQAVYESLG